MCLQSTYTCQRSPSPPPPPPPRLSCPRYPCTHHPLIHWQSSLFSLPNNILDKCGQFAPLILLLFLLLLLLPLLLVEAVLCTGLVSSFTFFLCFISSSLCQLCLVHAPLNSVSLHQHRKRRFCGMIRHIKCSHLLMFFPHQDHFHEAFIESSSCSLLNVLSSLRCALSETLCISCSRPRSFVSTRECMRLFFFFFLSRFIIFIITMVTAVHRSAMAACICCCHVGTRPHGVFPISGSTRLCV